MMQTRKTTQPGRGTYRRPLADASRLCRLALVGLLGTAMLAIGGCATAKQPPANLAQKHVPIPAHFTRYPVVAATPVAATRPASTQPPATQPADINDWVARFDSPALSKLVAEALAHNPDLQATAALWRQAQAQAQLAAADLYPHLNGAADVHRSDPGHGIIKTNYSAQVNASWQVDIWGTLAEQAAQASEQAKASRLEYRFARFSLAATVTQAYFTAIAAKLQLAIDQDLLALDEHTAKIATAKVRLGASNTPLDAEVSQANVSLARNAVTADKQAIERATRAIEILLGRYPADALKVAVKLPKLPGPPMIGVPSQLLERRPDVIAADHRVAAAFHEVQYVQAARLPQITLTASLGAVLDPTSALWSIGAGLLQPLYEGGSIKAGIQLAQAAQREAVANYVSVGIAAFSEVENALANEHYLTQRQQQLAAAVKQLKKASRVAQDRYDAGIITILNLTQVRTQYFTARAQLLGVRANRLLSRIQLYLALGGAPEPANVAAAATQPSGQ